MEQLLLPEVLQQLPVGVVVAEAPSGRLLMGNGAVERIWRHEFHRAADISSYAAYRGFYPDGREYEPEEWPLARTVRTGERVEGEEIRFLRGDGTHGFMRMSTSPVCEPDGRVVAAVAVFEDVTEAREAEEEMARLAAIVEGSHDSVITLDRDCRILTWNAGAERLYGYPRCEAVGMPYRLVLSRASAGQMEERIGALFAGERFVPFESLRVLRDGREYPVSVTLSPVRDRQGRVVAVSAVARDISAQKRMEEELRQANSAKDEFLGFVSHEMRNPLTSVVGLAEAMYRRAGSMPADVLQETMGQLVHDARRLQSLIENMLVLARLDHSEPETEPVLLQRLIRRLAREQETAGHRVEVALDDDLPPAEAQPTWAEQVLENLVGNALKYSGPHGRIRIDASADPESVTVRVLDTGPGVDGEQLDQVFRAFERLERDRARAQGSGLGLAVCRRLVEMMGGAIWAEAPGEGWGGRFVFRLPRVESGEPRKNTT